MFKSATVLLVLAGGLTLTACGDPSESVPQAPPAQQVDTGGGFELEIDIDGHTKTKTKTVTAPPVATVPRYTPPATVPRYTPPPAVRTIPKYTPPPATKKR
jgi:hypothetical protein